MLCIRIGSSGACVGADRFSSVGLATVANVAAVLSVMCQAAEWPIVWSGLLGSIHICYLAFVIVTRSERD